MKGLHLPSNDQERLNALSTIYLKGLSTPKEDLAFSAEMLVYLKPFMTKLQASNTDNNINLNLVRQIVDELLSDIYEEVQNVCMQLGGKRGERIAAAYGMRLDFNSYVADYYSNQKVA